MFKDKEVFNFSTGRFKGFIRGEEYGRVNESIKKEAISLKGLPWKPFYPGN